MSAPQHTAAGDAAREAAALNAWRRRVQASLQQPDAPERVAAEAVHDDADPFADDELDLEGGHL